MKYLVRSLGLTFLLFVLALFGRPDNSFGRSPKLITEAQARTIALHKTHGARVVHAELNHATGKSLWLVDVSIQGSKNAKEVTIDAHSGKVVSVQTQRPSDRAEDTIGSGH